MILKILKKHPYLICTVIYALLIGYSYTMNPFYIERMRITDGTMITKGTMLRNNWYYFAQDGIEYRLQCSKPITPSDYCDELAGKLWVYNAEMIAYPSLCKTSQFFTKSEKWCKFIFTTADFKEFPSAKKVIEYRLSNEIVERHIQQTKKWRFFTFNLFYLLAMFIIFVCRR